MGVSKNISLFCVMLCWAFVRQGLLALSLLWNLTLEWLGLHSKGFYWLKYKINSSSSCLCDVVLIFGLFTHAFSFQSVFFTSMLKSFSYIAEKRRAEIANIRWRHDRQELEDEVAIVELPENFLHLLCWSAALSFSVLYFRAIESYSADSVLSFIFSLCQALW